MGHGVHAGGGDQLLGHRLGQIGIDDGDVGGDLKVGQGVLDALLVVGDDGEGGDLGGGAGGGGDGAEVSLGAQLGQAEDLAHILEGDLGVLILDPHGLGRVDGGAAAHGDDPVGLELAHGLGAAHDGGDGGIGLNALEDLDLHAGLLQIGDDAVQETKALHGAAADTDHRPLAGQCLQHLKGALAVVEISG